MLMLPLLLLAAAAASEQPVKSCLKKLQSLGIAATTTSPTAVAEHKVRSKTAETPLPLRSWTKGLLLPAVSLAGDPAAHPFIAKTVAAVEKTGVTTLASFPAADTWPPETMR